MAKKRKVVEIVEVEEKRGGCLKPVLIVFAVLIALAIFSPSVKKDTSKATTTATPTVKATATARPTNTPKPTAAPTPSPSPVPNYSDMSIEQAAETLANYYANRAFEYKSVFEIGGAVCLEMTLKPFLTEKSAVRDCCIFALGVSEYLFDNPNVESLVIYFDTDGRDAYGNETSVRAMEILFNRETALKINYNYMKDHVWASTKDLLEITDRYFVHNDLREGIYD